MNSSFTSYFAKEFKSVLMTIYNKSLQAWKDDLIAHESQTLRQSLTSSVEVVYDSMNSVMLCLLCMLSLRYGR
jgi:hypothetical protein